MPDRLDPIILPEYDLRGTVGKTSFAVDAEAIGRAGRRVAGYDGRLTSPELESALIKGLAAGGADALVSVAG
jgi:phosphomannomutase